MYIASYPVIIKPFTISLELCQTTRKTTKNKYKSTILNINILYIDKQISPLFFFVDKKR